MEILVNKNPIEIEEGKRFTVLVHQPGVRVDIPDSVEINGRNTIDCMAKMTQKQWEWISTGDLFKYLFNKVFEDTGVIAPANIQELNDGDFGTIHVCGIIIIGCEAVFAGKKRIFIREPETHLHPKIERTVMSMIYELIHLAGGEDVVVNQVK